MTTKFGYSLHGVRRTSNEKHVLLKADDRSQSLAENRMILYAQDANGLGLNHLRASLRRLEPHGVSPIQLINFVLSRFIEPLGIHRSPLTDLNVSPDLNSSTEPGRVGSVPDA